ncbi:hypothetical protein ON010_g1346 [Phytophthora cinnamomi]|nr:hypothetical protein ON010_g1346 [Phytophthora cinnamomi]
MRVYALLLAAAAVVAPTLAGSSTTALNTVQSSAANSTTSSGSSSSSLPTVELDYTTVQAVGGNTTVGYYKHQNIRFAKVPSGDLRFAAPEWPDVETEINTRKLANIDVECKTSEDRQYLDVWPPANAAGRNLPVIVWTYGGSFPGGSKSENTPEGLFDLIQDFVFVAYNYRVGITGLTNGPAYQHEGGVSNPYVWDSTHAFEWVQKYISKFGGNPNDVTAAGFSAGASQVMFQMTRFGGNAPQLFQKAYIMSPGYVPGAGHHTPSSSGRMYRPPWAARVATWTACARYRSTIWSMLPTPSWTRTRTRCSLAWTAGHHEANSHEYSGVETQEDVSTYLRIFFPGISDDAVDKLLELYPEADYESAGLRFADMKQSFDLTAKNLALTNALNNQTWNAQVSLGEATHCFDQNYYWYSTYSLSTASESSSATTSSLSSDEAASVGAVTTTVNATIAVMMQKYLMSFVLAGNPNSIWADDKIYWPLYNESRVGTQIVFNDTFTVADDDLANAKRLFWNKALWY